MVLGRAGRRAGTLAAHQRRHEVGRVAEADVESILGGQGRRHGPRRELTAADGAARHWEDRERATALLQRARRRRRNSGSHRRMTPRPDAECRRRETPLPCHRRMSVFAGWRHAGLDTLEPDAVRVLT